MAPKRRQLVDKSYEPEEEPSTRKRAKTAQEETALAIVPQGSRKPRRQKSDDDEEQIATMPTKRGGGRGLKAVQTSHEEEKTRSKANGEKEDSKTKVKEQKLFHARTNAHVETKVVTEDNRKKVGRNGTTTVTSSTTVKKVTYL